MKVFGEEELKSIAAFEKKHLDCYHKEDTKCKRVSFTITQDWTGIGVITKITCNCCGEQEDVTDYGNW